MTTLSINDKATEARDAITQLKLFQPTVAIVLGSGLGGLADEVSHATAISYSDIPHFPRTHAAGHAGKLILGFLAGMPVVLMQGRAHRYEGFSTADVQLPIHCMHALGATTLVTTNAAGGLNTRFQTGDLMVIDSHMNWLWAGAHANDGVEFIETGQVARGGQCYDFDLIRRCHQLARQSDTRLHQGCYLATLGPTYETRGEYRMFRGMGADAVGMSTVPEVLAARRLGMNVLAFSVITNVASTDIPQSTTHDEVVNSGKQAGPRLMNIVKDLLEDMSGQPD